MRTTFLRALTAVAVLSMAACAMEVGPSELIAEPENDELVTSNGKEQSLQATAMTLGNRKVFVHFANPDLACSSTDTSPTNCSLAIQREMIRLIRATPENERIDMTVKQFGSGPHGHAIADELKAAGERGVRVHIVTGQGNRPKQKRLADNSIVLEGNMARVTNWWNNPVKNISIHYCGKYEGRKLLSSACWSPDGGFLHSKLMVISGTKSPDDPSTLRKVVWFGSFNPAASGWRSFNDAVTIYDDTTLYTEMLRYLNRLRDSYDDKERPFFKRNQRGHYTGSATARVWASPSDVDFIYDELDSITPDTNCTIKVLQATINRQRIVDRLHLLAQNGCHVEVLMNATKASWWAGLPSGSTGSLKKVIRPKVHNKAFIIHARFAGSTSYQRRVYTGSHNLSGRALTHQDEIFIRLTPESPLSSPVYDAYLGHFNTVKAGYTLSLSNADTTPPTLSLNVGSNSYVPNNFTLAATATDNDAILEVAFKQGEDELSVDDEAPYEYMHDGALDNGSEAFTVTAIDVNGNETTQAVSLLQDTVPPVINALWGDTTIGPNKNGSFTADATDNVGVSKVDFSLGSTFLGSDTTRFYDATASVGTLLEGQHNLTATAFDTSGNTATRTYGVMVDRTAPVFSLDELPSSLAGRVWIGVGVSDASRLSPGSARIDLLRGDGTLYSSAPLHEGWLETGFLPNGTYSLVVKGSDLALNAGSLTRTITVNNPTPPLSAWLKLAGSAPAKPWAYVPGTRYPRAYGVIPLAAEAVGNVSKVEFLNDTYVLGSDTTAPYEYSWVTQSSTSGTLPIHIKIVVRVTSTTGEVVTTPGWMITLLCPQVGPCGPGVGQL
jgi:phosphatidylserine/phosphatidylglycerophosphate/cardiolipin synthase-like enzyme